MRRSVQRNASVLVPLVLLGGCSGLGRVNQGQVVEYRKDQGLVTIIADSNYRDPAHPKFDVLPPVTIRTPGNPQEMGPEPEPGKLLLFDHAGRRVVVFDPVIQSLRTVTYTLVSEKDNVRPSDSSVSRTRFPIVDRARRTITVYSPRDSKLVVFTPAEEYFALPDDTWKIGDEIRYYYKDPARALRLMNVSKTDLNKGGK